MTQQNNTQLAVVVFSDIVNYTKLSSESQSEAVEIVKQHENDVIKLISKYNGKVLKNLGDGLLLKFDSSRNSVLFSIELQKTNKSYELRISIHQGDMIVEDNDIFGDSVNIASRINNFCAIGGIVVSKNIYNDIVNERDILASHIGDYNLKGKKDLISLYTITNENIKVEQSIVRKNAWAKSTKTISRKSDGVGYFVSSMPTPLWFFAFIFFKILSAAIHFGIYYYIYGLLVHWLNCDIIIKDVCNKYLSITSINVESILGFIGFIRGITLGGCVIDFNTMNVKLKINRSTFFKINEAEYSIMIGMWGTFWPRK